MQHRNVALLVPFAAVILTFAHRGYCSAVLGARCMVALGECSFAFYMTHHMIFKEMDGILSGVAPPLVGLAAALTVAVVASVVVHYSFERPMRSLLGTRRQNSSFTAGNNV
jgi:peptidoglycan/LPS O-acetylase OafA/YrhL